MKVPARVDLTLTGEQVQIALLAVTRQVDLLRPTYSPRDADEKLSRWISTQNALMRALGVEP